MPSLDILEVQRALHYEFHQPLLLEEALTHRSYVNELKRANQKDNERLEFLGDAILALVISEYLVLSYPEASEGDLSRKKAVLVSEASLAKAALGINLGQFLRLGRGEEQTRGREKPSLLANALEAVIAAVYLDGGLNEARAFAKGVLEPMFEEVNNGASGSGSQDYKTVYQEWCQKRFDTLPRYLTVRETGPDHEKTFEVNLSIHGDVVGTGVGRTKKEAEQQAAKQALDVMISS